MEAPLTSWKDIARYLGKGVRTVQRWELESGLPVRRAEGTHRKAPVFAIPEEIDSWIRTRSPRSEDDEVGRLRRENARLRERLEHYESEEAARTRRVAQAGDLSIIIESRRLIQRTSMICQQYSDTLDWSRRLRRERSISDSRFVSFLAPPQKLHQAAGGDF